MVFDCQIPRFSKLSRLQLVSPGRRYRAWSREEKERVVGEKFFAGGERVGDCAVSRARSSSVVCLATQDAGLGTGRPALWREAPLERFTHGNPVCAVSPLIYRLGTSTEIIACGDATAHTLLAAG